MVQPLDISVVIPVFNEDESIGELSKWIAEVMTKNHFQYEIIMVDDGSTDNSWEVIKQLNLSNSSVKGIKFLRNYGKSAALNVGFQESLGKVVVTMDADLQDSPDEIPELFRMVNDSGYEMVSGWKKKRYDPLSKTIPSKIFNFVTRKMSGLPLHDFNCGLKAYKSQVVKSISIYGEMHRYIPVIAKWNGYRNIGEKVVQHRPRKYGVTKFGLERFLFGFLDLVSITFVTKFKKRPMHFFGTLGIFSFLSGMIITIWLISEKLYYNLYLKSTARSVVDQPLFFLALVAVIIGVQLFLSGFLGEMLVMIDREKNIYSISETAGLN